MQLKCVRTTAVALATTALLIPSMAATAAAPVTDTFSFTGGEQQFVVPNGVSVIHVVLVGGRGGDFIAPEFVGGAGARVEGDLAVTPGSTLYIEVAGNGGNAAGEPVPAGFNGGGTGGDCVGFSGASGGGASDIRSVPRAQGGSLTSRLIVAGGGGGWGDNGNGGPAGNPGSGANAGGAGTSAMGGAGGGGANPGGSGVLGIGGSAADSPEGSCGAGGGGGYFGGGGGGADFQGVILLGGSGGGGSSFTGTATQASVTLDTSGTPSVAITYVPVPDQGTVGADVNVLTSAACLELSTTHVSFGTLALGDEDMPASPTVTITNCSGSAAELLASGSDATGTGALWELVDGGESCDDALGLDRYRLNLASAAWEAEVPVSPELLSFDDLASGQSSEQTVKIWMACPGSSGAGQLMSMSINYVAVEEEE